MSMHVHMGMHVHMYSLTYSFMYVHTVCITGMYIHTLNWEIFTTNNIHDFRELTSLANFFVANIPAHIPKYSYRPCKVRLAKLLVTNFSAYRIWRRFTKFTVREYFPI